jgi:hypothetical protein
VQFEKDTYDSFQVDGMDKLVRAEKVDEKRFGMQDLESLAVFWYHLTGK